jgi:acetylglutamate kinase
VVLLKQAGINPVIVHGGGPQIGKMQEQLGLESRFVDGVRVTDAASIGVVQMVLRGLINSQIVAALNRAGGDAIGLSGIDAAMIRVEKLVLKGQDMGLVGPPRHVRSEILAGLVEDRFIPVVAPLGVDDAGTVHNINADTAAGAIAAAMSARRLLLLTDVAGVLDAEKRLIPHMSESEARALIDNGTISGGMIPKVQTCLDAVVAGVEGAVILDGRVDHALLLQLFGDGGASTLIGRSAGA